MDRLRRPFSLQQPLQEIPNGHHPAPPTARIHLSRDALLSPIDQKSRHLPAEIAPVSAPTEAEEFVDSWCPLTTVSTGPMIMDEYRARRFPMGRKKQIDTSMYFTSVRIYASLSK